MKTNATFLFLIILLFGCKSNDKNLSRVDRLPFYTDPTFTPKWVSFDESEDSLHQISDFKLYNQDGRMITKKDFEGKIYVADFFFTTCPGICLKMTNNMKVIQDQFINDDEILFLSHSVTPEKDSIAVLKKYADEKGIISSEKWHLATGERKEIYRLGRHDYFADEDLGERKDENDFLHTENFFLVDKKGHIRGIYNGLSLTSIQQLIADIKTLKSEL